MQTSRFQLYTPGVFASGAPASGTQDWQFMADVFLPTAPRKDEWLLLENTLYVVEQVLHARGRAPMLLLREETNQKPILRG